MNRTRRVVVMVDPRFPGGTSSAVARELDCVAPEAQVEVAAIRSGMFRDREIAPVLAQTVERLGIRLVWDPPAVSGDLVILHNPSFLKFDAGLAPRIMARHLVVVSHENFLRPGGHEAFDVAGCLEKIDAASVALRKTIAPVSAHNRATVTEWLQTGRGPAGWDVLDRDWFNICDFAQRTPPDRPADRRGRLSRPGFEKFPSLCDLDRCFPSSAERNVILGADTLIDGDVRRPHWKLLRFGEMGVDDFFGMIDFMVYFTAPTWRESFGRVIAEAVAAGKVVISDPATASGFGGAAVAAAPDEVDGIVARMIAAPSLFHRQVARAQAALTDYSAPRFLDHFRQTLMEAAG